jgi:hypothetical protein
MPLAWMLLQYCQHEQYSASFVERPDLMTVSSSDDDMHLLRLLPCRWGCRHEDPAPVVQHGVRLPRGAAGSGGVWCCCKTWSGWDLGSGAWVNSATREAAARVRSCGSGGEVSIPSEFTGMRRQRPRLGYRESGGGGHGWGRGRQGENGIDRLDFVTESVGWIGMEGQG